MTGSGKTTLAVELEQVLPGIRFSTDDWMIELFGHHMPRELFDERHGVIKERVWQIVERLVALRVNVVLDFGFWRAEERAAAAQRVRAAGGEPVLIFMKVAMSTLERRLQHRNANLPTGTFEITREMLQEFLAIFQVPSADEGLMVVEVSESG